MFIHETDCVMFAFIIHWYWIHSPQYQWNILWAPGCSANQSHDRSSPFLEVFYHEILLLLLSNLTFAHCSQSSIFPLSLHRTRFPECIRSVQRNRVCKISLGLAGTVRTVKCLPSKSRSNCPGNVSWSYRPHVASDKQSLYSSLMAFPCFYHTGYSNFQGAVRPLRGAHCC